MAVFIETQTDPFAGALDAMASDLQNSRQVGKGGVRRPVRGIEIKQDTYAVLRVLKSDGTFINVIDQAGGILEGDGVAKTANYTNFFIQTVAEERHEKQQIVDTFGDSFIFFFGEAPRITQVSGWLLNTNDFNWRSEFWENYERYFRGTRLVEQNARLYLIFDDVIIEGYMLSAQAQDDANRPHLIQFGFSMFVTGYSTISKLGDPNFPQPDDGIDYSKLSSYSESLKRSEANRAIQKETNTEITRRRLREAQSGGGLLGFIGGILDTVTGGLVNPDLSVSVSFSFGGGADPVPPFPPTRKTPLRTTFRDNKDEFIGGNDYLNSRSQASPFNLIYYWQSLDHQVDNSLFGLVADIAGGAVFDVMGRGGRATAEMSTGGASLSFGASSSSQASNSGTSTVPFGIVATKEF